MGIIVMPPSYLACSTLRYKNPCLKIACRTGCDFIKFTRIEPSLLLHLGKCKMSSTEQCAKPKMSQYSRMLQMTVISQGTIEIAVGPWRGFNDFYYSRWLQRWAALLL